MRAIACAGGKILLLQTSFSRCTALDIIARALRTVFHVTRMKTENEDFKGRSFTTEQQIDYFY